LVPYGLTSYSAQVFIPSLLLEWDDSLCSTFEQMTLSTIYMDCLQKLAKIADIEKIVGLLKMNDENDGIFQTLQEPT